MNVPSLQTLVFAFLTLASTACANPAGPESKNDSESPPAPLALSNLLANAHAAAWRIGELPPKPWQVPNPDPEIVTEVVDRNGDRWIELRDDSTEKSASLRQQFQPLKAGRLSFRLAVAADHVGQIGIFLGQGNASSEVERIVELKLDSRGNVMMGSAGKREKTAVILSPGMSDHLFIEFSTANENLNLSFGRVTRDGTDSVVTETTIPLQGHAVSGLRIATDLAPRGGHFYVTDLLLSTRPPAAPPNAL
jgi:hypothetical protein